MALLPNSPAIDTGNSSLLALNPASALPVIADPGFETPALAAGSHAYAPARSGWTFASNAGLASNGSAFNNPPAPEGSQVAFLQQTGSISQVVDLPAGMYVMNFMAAQRPGNQQTFEVDLDGTELATVTPSGSRFALYSSGTFIVVTAGPHTIQFIGLNPNGGDNTAFLDQILIAPPTEQDQRGDPRISGTHVDIGAFEYQYPTLVPSSHTLPNGTYGAAYTQAITATGDGAPISVVFLQGKLPPGLTLNSDGTWSGTPTALGTFSFIVTATDSNGYTSDYYYFVTITQATPTVTVTDGGTYNGNPYQAVGSAVGADGHTPVAGSFSYLYFVNVSEPLIGLVPLLINGEPTAAGSYDVLAGFTSSDPNYASTSSALTSFTIAPAAPTVTVSDGGIYNAQPDAATATALGVDGTTPVAGSFSFTYYAGSSAGGTPLSGAPVNVGTYTVVASFTSNDSNYTGGSAQTTFAINPDPTSIDVSASNATLVYGQGVTLTATVTTPPGGLIPTSTDGTVTFYVDGAAFGSPQALSGSPAAASLTNVLLTAGQHTITAVYSGDTNFVGSQSGVEPTSRQVVVLPHGIAGLHPSASDGQGDFFLALPFPDEVVESKADGSQTTVGSGLLFPTGVKVDGQGDVFIDDLRLDHEVEVLAGLPVSVSQATPTLAVSDGGVYNAQPFTATPTALGVDGKTAVAGSFTLTYYAGSSASGTALTSPPTSAGIYTVVATFTSNDPNYSSGGTAQTTFLIRPDPTSIAVSASSAAPVYGQGVTLTATVTTPSGSPMPASTDGTVTVYVDGAVFGSPLALSGSPAAASLTNVVLPAGPHTITARYSGDNNFATSLSGVEPTSPQVVVGGLAGLSGTAIDGQGDVFFPDTFDNRVLELKADGTNTTVGSGLLLPTGVAVDGQGDVFIDDFGHNREVEVLAGLPVTVSPATPTVTVSDGGIYNGNAHPAVGSAVGVDGKTAVAGSFSYTYYASDGTTVLNGAPTMPGSYYVTAAFTSSDSNYGNGSSTQTGFTIQTPPTSITGPTIGVPGQPLTYTFAVTYGPNGPTQGITFTVNYGDGTTVTTSAGGPSITLDHLYSVTGTFTIQVTAKDSKWVVSQLASQSVKVSTLALETDPSGGTALAIGGNAAGGDTILVTGANTSGTAVNVTMNKIALGTFTPTGHILVYGQGAKETITLQPDVVGKTTYYIQVPALLYGEGSGGDHFNAAGSAANNVLTGHGTNEVLTGGQGRDLLIGGTGAATLNAGTEDDILIGGSTNYDIGSNSGLTYDQQLAALNAIMAEWGSTDSYATRLSALAGQLNSSTVHDNYAGGKAVADQLLGNANANDWFFTGLNDAVKGKSKNAVVTSIT
jgi:hypothetical protein